MTEQPRRLDGEFGFQPRALTERGRRPNSATEQDEPAAQPPGSAGASQSESDK